MSKFRQADIDGSLEDFNQALQLDPAIRPYLWQRGLSLFYAGKLPGPIISMTRSLFCMVRGIQCRAVTCAEKWKEAAQQFRDDVAVNPSDTEEAIWAFLSEARIEGPDRARSHFLQVLDCVPCLSSF
jgi:tetratricopeptide (TPR) repeat protein